MNLPAKPLDLKPVLSMICQKSVALLAIREVWVGKRSIPAKQRTLGRHL